MQIKELQTRLDTGDGCKYNSIHNATNKSYTKVSYLNYYGDIISAIVIQAAVIHVTYVFYKCFCPVYNSFRH